MATKKKLKMAVVEKTYQIVYEQGADMVHAYVNAESDVSARNKLLDRLPKVKIISVTEKVAD